MPMTKKKLLLLITLFVISSGLQAAHRSLLQKKEAALQVLTKADSHAPTRAPGSSDHLKVIAENAIFLPL